MEEHNDIIIFKDNDLELEVKITPDKDTVWLTQDQMAQLFDVDRTRILRHISNIYKDNELISSSTSAENAQVQIEGERTVTRKVQLYNLDMIISVGYRVKSKRGITFRKWANNVLREYMYKGFAVDTKRLTQSEENYKEFSLTIKMIADMVNRKTLTSDESAGFLSLISKYAYALDTLDKYDHQTLTIVNIRKSNKEVKLDYQ